MSTKDFEQGPIIMGMNIDESRRDDAVGSIDDAAARKLRRDLLAQ